nr:hypothetical protein SHINE37_70327 [Rhizobiaceae bacterium]
MRHAGRRAVRRGDVRHRAGFGAGYVDARQARFRGGRRWRHALPRPGDGSFARLPDEARRLSRKPDFQPPRLDAAAQGAHQPHHRHQCRAAGPDRERRFSPRPLLPHRRRNAGAADAARPAGARHRTDGTCSAQAECRAHAGLAAFPGLHEAARRPCLSGQCARADQHPRARGGERRGYCARRTFHRGPGCRAASFPRSLGQRRGNRAGKLPGPGAGLRKLGPGKIHRRAWKQEKRRQGARYRYRHPRPKDEADEMTNKDMKGNTHVDHAQIRNSRPCRRKPPAAGAGRPGGRTQLPHLGRLCRRWLHLEVRGGLGLQGNGLLCRLER